MWPLTRRGDDGEQRLLDQNVFRNALSALARRDLMAFNALFWGSGIYPYAVIRLRRRFRGRTYRIDFEDAVLVAAEELIRKESHELERIRTPHAYFLTVAERAFWKLLATGAGEIPTEDLQAVAPPDVANDEDGGKAEHPAPPLTRYPWPTEFCEAVRRRLERNGLTHDQKRVAELIIDFQATMERAPDNHEIAAALSLTLGQARRRKSEVFQLLTITANENGWRAISDGETPGPYQRQEQENPREQR